MTADEMRSYCEEATGIKGCEICDTRFDDYEYKLDMIDLWDCPNS